MKCRQFRPSPNNKSGSSEIVSSPEAYRITMSRRIILFSTRPPPSASHRPRLTYPKPKVDRLGPDNQGGFNWTVTFTSDNQDGDLPLITVEANDVTGSEVLVELSSVEDGSYLDGYVNVSFAGNSSSIAANATAEDMRVALEAIGTGSLAVSREGDALLTLAGCAHWRVRAILFFDGCCCLRWCRGNTG